MTDSLTTWVFDHLIWHEADDRTTDLALAAMAGEEDLRLMLSGEDSPAVRPQPSTATPVVAGAFLRSLTVQGFRGIGPQAHIELQPTPGLTIIAGRNGSGKSSLAEALEVALTKETHRWHNTQFSQVWRNLHAGEPAEIKVELAQEGVGRSTITVSWPKDEQSSGAARVSYQRAGGKKELGLDSLGWAEPLAMYRPILSYEELGTMLTGRAIDLHRALVKVLGLDEIQAGVDRLTVLRKPLRGQINAADTARKHLKALLAEVDDERAAAAVRLLGKSAPDTEALSALATGETAVNTTGQVLSQIAAITIPTSQQVRAAVEALRNSAAELHGLRRQAERLDDLRTALLEEALRYHDESGMTTCPVCEQGTLDQDWRTRTERAVTQSSLLGAERQLVQSRLQAARSQARTLLVPVPDVVAENELGLHTQDAIRAAWKAWVEPPTTDSELADHLIDAHAVLAQDLAAWQSEAADLAAARSDVWTPLATQLAAWIAQHDAARQLSAQEAELGTAIKALQAAEVAARKERFAPIVEHAKRIWAMLRHESNVDLQDIELTGSGNARKVGILASVDQAESGALAVMSQGELHALALALFLPRAAMPDSPFRFIILDDPVQAMDPAKVEGLVAVLADLALTRQVIVLSHDDRLPQAARRLPQPPRILEVTRGVGSQVRITSLSDPADRFLGEASSLIKDAGLPEATLRLVLPGLFRFALESAARDRYLSQQITAGVEPAQADQIWNAATTTSKRVALALGRPDVTSWLANSPQRRRALGVGSSGMHSSLGGNIEEALHDARSTVLDIRNGRA